MIKNSIEMEIHQVTFYGKNNEILFVFYYRSEDSYSKIEQKLRDSSYNIKDFRIDTLDRNDLLIFLNCEMPLKGQLYTSCNP